MIRADGLAKVKLRIVLALSVALIATHPARAELSEKEVQGLEQQEFGIENGKKQNTTPDSPQKPDAPPADYQPEAEPEKVKPIEAEEFKVKFSKQSHNGHVLMLEDPTDNRPHPGKMLLLKNGETDIAAVRVLKNYPGKFAAKIVLPVSPPQSGAEYRALMKLGDKIIQQIREREKRGKDLDAAKTDEDLAKEVSPDDNELDRGIPTPKTKSPGKKGLKPEGSSGPGDPEKKMPEPLFTKDGQEIDAESILIKEEDEGSNDLLVQEDLPIEQHHHAVSLQYGSVRSLDFGGSPTSYDGVGLRYAYNLWRMAFLHRRTLQDMFSLEGSLFYYTVSNFDSLGNGITVYTMTGALRYTLMIGETFSLFGYAGMAKNNVSAGNVASPTLNAATQLMATTKAALGVGALFKIGPAWAVRLDFGNDLFGIGAVLKF